MNSSNPPFRPLAADPNRRLARRLATGVLSFLLAGTLAVPLKAQTPERLVLPPADVNFERAFSQITSVRELSDGRVLVADLLENEIALLGPQGGSLQAIRRIGDGPGEYRRVGMLYPLAGDSTILTDFQSRRWLILDQVEAVRTLPAHHAAASGLGPIMSGADAHGWVLGVAGYAFTQGPGMADSLRLIHMDLEGLRADTLAILVGQGHFSIFHERMPNGMNAVRRHPLRTEDQAKLFPDGWIAVAHMQPYRVDWRAPDGSWIRGSPLPMTRTPLTDRERCFAVQRQAGDTRDQPCAQSVVRRWEWPAEVPAFPLDALSAAPGGHLLILRTPVSARPGNHYDVVGRQGERVATIELAGDEAVVGFGREAIYIVHTDPLGLQTLRRHPWPL